MSPIRILAAATILLCAFPGLPAQAILFEVQGPVTADGAFHLGLERIASRDFFGQLRGWSSVHPCDVGCYRVLLVGTGR